jgi:hypothetical protein
MIATTARRERWVIVLLTAALAAGCASASDEYRPFLAYSTAGPPRRHFVQVARPDGCTGTTEPAVIDFTGTPPTPIWTCLKACPPASEYVTSVEVVDHFSDGRPVSGVTPSCRPACAASEHRAAYVDFGDHPPCVPGPEPDPERRAAAEAERRRLANARDQEEEGRIAGLEDCLRAVRTASDPWTVANIERYRHCQKESFILASDYRKPHPSHGEPCNPQRPLCERWAAAQSALDEFGPVAHQAVARLGLRKGQTRDQRIARCQSFCDGRQESCNRDCKDLPSGACEACRHKDEACRGDCAAAEAR